MDGIKEKAEAAGFTMVSKAADGMSFRKGSLTVIYSISKELDGKEWLHVSLARPNKYPPYEEIKYVKNIFIGDSKAVMIFPEAKEHVNIHNYCMHLFMCLDGDPLPDFSRGMGTL